MSGQFSLLPCFIEILVFNANSIYPDQTPRSVASDLGLHCLPMSRLWDARHKWVKAPSKIRSRRHSIFIFSIFQRKDVLTRHVNRLLNTRFTCFVKTYFLWKNKKKRFKMSSAAVVTGALRVNSIITFMLTNFQYDKYLKLNSQKSVEQMRRLFK